HNIRHRKILPKTAETRPNNFDAIFPHSRDAARQVPSPATTYAAFFLDSRCFADRISSFQSPLSVTYSNPLYKSRLALPTVKIINASLPPTPGIARAISHAAPEDTALRVTGTT